MNKDHDQQRKKLWCDVYVAYVGADNATDKYGAKEWADVALSELDKRFPEKKEKTA